MFGCIYIYISGYGFSRFIVMIFIYISSIYVHIITRDVHPLCFIFSFDLSAYHRISLCLSPASSLLVCLPTGF